MSSTTRESFPFSRETIPGRIRDRLGTLASSLLVDRHTPTAKAVPEVTPQLEAPYQHLNELRSLTFVARHDPSTKAELQSRVDELATPLVDVLASDLRKYKNRGSAQEKLVVGIETVLTAARAWDTFKTPDTERLLVGTINGLHGEGAAKYNKAYVLAKKNAIDFSTAFDEIEDIRDVSQS